MLVTRYTRLKNMERGTACWFVPASIYDMKKNDSLKGMDQLKQDLVSQYGMNEHRAGRIVFREFLGAVQSEIPTEEYDRHITAIENELPTTDESIGIELSAEDIETLYEDPTILEQVYTELVPREDRRSNGQFFTPAPVAEFMAAQVPTEARYVLDPTTGTGVFLESLRSRDSSPPLSLVGVDTDPLMIFAACIRLSLVQSSADVSFSHADFLTEYRSSDRFDAIICNPPYNGFHAHDTSLVPTFESRFDIELGGLSNRYPLFLLRASELLTEDGMLVFITPGEFLDTGYGVGLKRFMKNRMNIEAILCLDWDEPVFNALTTATITILSKAEPADSVRFIRSTTPEDLSGLSLSAGATSGTVESREVTKTALDPEQKWNRHFSKVAGTEYLDATVPLSNLVQTKRGIATGCNDFFTLSMAEVDEWGIEDEFLSPVISKATQAPEYTFTETDWQELRSDGQNTYLLYCTDAPSENLHAYLEHGKEKYNAHERYLTSNRSPWYAPEKRDPAPILATVFSRENMRFVFNETRVRNLAAFHCLYPTWTDEQKTKALLGYLNSKTALELATLQKRTYADGLSKFEPGDISQLPALDIRRLGVDAVSSLATSFERLDVARRARDDQQIAEVKQSLDTVVTDLLDSRLDTAWKESITSWS